MSEIKTIKGKVDILVFPLGSDGLTTNRQDDMTIRSLYYQRPWFYFSKATEEQCSLLVDGYGIGWHNYLVESQYEERLKKTAKESLFSLLKANDCFIKEWVEKPKQYIYNIYFDSTYTEAPLVHDEVRKYDNTPDDYLLIKKQ